MTLTMLMRLVRCIELAVSLSLEFRTFPLTSHWKLTSLQWYITRLSRHKADAMLMKMPDGENKMMGMQEMTSAKSSMSQKDMAGCKEHMNKAMEMGMMKSKKM